MPKAEIIRIEMSEGKGGADVARYEGFEVASRHGAEMALARTLVEAGFSDGPWQTECRGQVRLFGPSLHRLARLTLSEGESRRISFTRWVPMADRAVAKAA